MDRLKASGQAPQQDVPQPAPTGIEPEAWGIVMKTPPILGSGSPSAQIMPHQYWAAAIKRLLSNPTQEEVDAFNKHYMGADGSNDGATIIQALMGHGEGIGAGLSAAPVPGSPIVAPPVSWAPSPGGPMDIGGALRVVGRGIATVPHLGEAHPKDETREQQKARLGL